VDRVDSGRLTREEILNPTGWVLLGFLSDPRTGLGRFRDFRISNYQLMEELINHCRNMSIEEILEQPDVKERVEMYFEQTRLFTEMIGEHTRTDGNVIVTDLRGVAPIYTGNRFLVYSLYPDQNVSLWVVDGKQKQNVAIACGYSILNRTCDADIGALMLSYGGGDGERRHRLPGGQPDLRGAEAHDGEVHSGQGGRGGTAGPARAEGVRQSSPEPVDCGARLYSRAPLTV